MEVPKKQDQVVMAIELSNKLQELMGVFKGMFDKLKFEDRTAGKGALLWATGYTSSGWATEMGRLTKHLAAMMEAMKAGKKYSKSHSSSVIKKQENLSRLSDFCRDMEHKLRSSDMEDKEKDELWQKLVNFKACVDNLIFALNKALDPP